MKSRITIEVDFENGNQPVIQILQHRNSDDVRDKLLSHFLQQFGGSSWCQIKWLDRPSPEINSIQILPIQEKDLKAHAKIMAEQNAVQEKFERK